MKEKSVALCIVFSLITCGLYGLYWFVCLTDDSLYVSKEKGTEGILALIFTIITCGIYGIYWSYKMGERIDMSKRMHNLPESSNSGILYLILSVIGLEIVAWALMQSELNKFTDSLGSSAGYTV